MWRRREERWITFFFVVVLLHVRLRHVRSRQVTADEGARHGLLVRGWRGVVGSGGEGRWAQIVLPGRRVTPCPWCVRRCGGGQRSGDTGRDATLDTDSGWWLRALFALGTFGFGCIEWETEVRVRVRDWRWGCVIRCYLGLIFVFFHFY